MNQRRCAPNELDDYLMMNRMNQAIAAVFGGCVLPVLAAMAALSADASRASVARPSAPLRILPLGDSITRLDGVPHGAACAVFDGDFIEYNERTETGKARMAQFYAALGVKPKVLKEYLPALSGVDLSLTEEEIRAEVRRVIDTLGKGGGLMISSAVMFSTVPNVDILVDDETAKSGRYDTLKFD